MKLQEGAPDAGVLREIALVKGERRREDKAAGELYKNMMAKVVAIDDDREDDGDDRRDGHDRRRDGGREPTASAKTSETSEAATRGPTGVSAAVVAFILHGERIDKVFRRLGDAAAGLLLMIEESW